MAVYMASFAKDTAGKMVAIWFPISAFIALGLEHSVANMFIIPLGSELLPSRPRGPSGPMPAVVGPRMPRSHRPLPLAPAVFSGAAVTWKTFLLSNLLPVTLGNIVGGAVCVGAAFCAAYGTAFSKKE